MLATARLSAHRRDATLLVGRRPKLPNGGKARAIVPRFPAATMRPLPACETALSDQLVDVGTNQPENVTFGIDPVIAV